ncbi:MAG TPA: purine-nucleoside phosphorylase [bacterium]|nr:purine-nucleoside phosphorylase [bacterium]HOX86013.1 purine-nucleoside phosphorylase [bacterium]HPG45004.1 purine-nucleoside phosphorylase [bacterium]HPM97246.1 purine-nucleoside phosphorylase [bacterium]
MTVKNRVLQASAHVAARFPRPLDCGLILGTGLGDIAAAVDKPVIIPYSEIPHFPQSTVAFHAGKLVLGNLAGQAVFLMQGRFHFYEGYSMQEITLPVRVMHQLGIRKVMITNAAGSIRPHLLPGTIAEIADHINLMGDNPLIGPHDPFLGERFPDMSEPYSVALRQLLRLTASEENIDLPRVVYAAVSGPSYETAAEIHMLQMIGADAVGMSTVPEVLVARQLGMQVVGLSVLTDQSLPEAMQPISHQMVSDISRQVNPQVTRLILGFLAKLEREK